MFASSTGQVHKINVLRAVGLWRDHTCFLDCEGNIQRKAAQHEHVPAWGSARFLRNRKTHSSPGTRNSIQPKNPLTCASRDGWARPGRGSPQWTYRAWHLAQWTFTCIIDSVNKEFLPTCTWVWPTIHYSDTLIWVWYHEYPNLLKWVG